MELFITCEPGIYSLQTGQGPLAADPACLSSHCELLQQPNLATLVVVRLPLPPLAGALCSPVAASHILLVSQHHVHLCGCLSLLQEVMVG